MRERDSDYDARGCIPFSLYHTLNTHRERDGRVERELLRDMLYLYRKKEGCETKRQKGRRDPEPSSKGTEGRKDTERKTQGGKDTSREKE